MKNVIKILPILILLMGLSVKPVSAAARLTLDPATKNLKVGESMEIAVNAYSETKTVAGIDAVITFDSAKLEASSVSLAYTGLSFKQTVSGNKITIALYKENYTELGATAINGKVATIVFKAKETGTATARFTCTTSTMTDSNILNMDGGTVTDIISCVDNGTGTYEISASSSATATSTPTTAASSNTNTPTPIQTTTAAQLPKTGSTETTVFLTIFGLLGVAGAFILRAL